MHSYMPNSSVVIDWNPNLFSVSNRSQNMGLLTILRKVKAKEKEVRILILVRKRSKRSRDVVLL